MKISDQVMRYTAGWPGSNDGICRVRIFYTAENGLSAIVTDLGDMNTGRSITNAIEQVDATMKQKGLVTTGCRLIEHYEKAFGGEMFHLVTFSHRGEPIWEDIGLEDVLSLTGCSRPELLRPTIEEPRLAGEITRIRNAIDPFADFPESEYPKVLARREEIRGAMISKSEVASLVQRGAIERDLLSLLRRDLSIFAEVYAHPTDEYICFAEFPLADGFVDFAVFTGRSVMEIVLIEIKGANFGLVTRGRQNKIADPISLAAQQVRTRMGHVYRDYESFRTTVHNLRIDLENGAGRGNFLIGPYTPLEVDPQKDVRVRGVVIGGRTRRDLEESKIRHDFDIQTKPPVILESWDTWLRKLQRV